MNGSFGLGGDAFAELERLQQQLEQVFRPTGLPTSIRGSSRGAFPAINLGGTPDSVEVLVFAPGIDAQALQLTVDKGLLVIAGERKAEARPEAERASVHARERFTGAFRRVISLPDDVDPAKVEANYRDGLLRVSIAKRESSKPRQIAIK
jgi:HSP20 family protein